ncbi:MAG: YwaF family protein [Clostridia bacterium]|nr:YwaF family protein [Clostridia bacterium]
MFSFEHILWIIISFVFVALIIFFYGRKKPSFEKVLNCAIIGCIASEILKLISYIKLVPSAGGEMATPYLPLSQLPLHMCSLQIVLIIYVRYAKNKDRRDYVLAFMYPTTIVGAISAMILPRIFRTDVTPDKAFLTPVTYQFFFYHVLLIALGVIIVRSGEINWQKRHLKAALIIFFVMSFASFYLNSVFAVPTYVDGKLVSVDFSTNFFYSYQNPLGITFTAIWQWYLYVMGMYILAVSIIVLFIYPLIFAQAKRVTVLPGKKVKQCKTNG